jgi:O-antigen/teichoic acid export membrane protein
LIGKTLLSIKSMITNTAARTVTEITNRAGSAIFWIVLARYLGATGLGSIAFGLSLFTFFTTISTLGLSSVVVRDVARDHKKAGKYFGHTLLTGSVTALIMSVVMILIATLLKPNSATMEATYWLAVALVPSAGFYWCRSVLTASEKMVYIAIARMGENIFKIVFGIAIMVGGFGVREVAFIIMLSKVVSFILAFRFASLHVAAPVWKIEKRFLRYMIKQAPSYFLISIFHGLFWSITVIMLTRIKGEAEAGIFSAALKIVDVCISFATAYGHALFPVSSRMILSSPMLFAKLFKKSIKYMLLLTFAIASTIAIMAPNVITFLYSGEMTASIQILQTLVWLLVPYSLIPIYAYTLINNHKPNRDLVSNFLATLTLFVGNLYLINSHGAYGAALTMLLGCCVFFLTEFYWVERDIIRLPLSFRNLIPLIGVVIMSLVVFTLKDIQPLLAVVAGIFVYMSFLWATNTLTDVEGLMVRYIKSN